MKEIESPVVDFGSLSLFYILMLWCQCLFGRYSP